MNDFHPNHVIVVARYEVDVLMQTDTKQIDYHKRCCVFGFKAVNYVNYRILYSDRAITQRSFHEQISEIIVFVRMYIFITYYVYSLSQTVDTSKMFSK